MKEQRRLAAIVSADVAGYSRLMGRDESGTLAALKALRREVIDPRIAAHGGRIVKTTGDGLLLDFPSVVDAVRCVVEVQTAMVKRGGDIAFRIGVNIGDIIIDGDDIFGDGVNIAARLQEIALPGGVCVSGRVHDDVRDRLDLPFEDGGAQTLKNIARPVAVWSWSPGESKPAPIATAPAHAPLALPDKPSIAVLPFQNMSGDPEQEYFADGMVEDIITALSRTKSLFVIARNSSFTYKGQSVDIKEVGRELGVRYVLEGSVRKSANRVRITGQLIDASSGAHLWADRFDGGLTDIFELQDQVTFKVVTSIAPVLERAEMDRAQRKPPENLQAYDYYLRGAASLYQFTNEANDEALALFHKAIELDPGFALPYARAAFCYQNRKAWAWTTDPAQEAIEADRLARRALSLDRDDPRVLTFAGWALAFVAGRADEGEALLARAVDLDPNSYSGWNLRGWVEIIRCGDRGIEYFERALRHNPLDPRLFGSMAGMANALFRAGRYDEAQSWASRSLQHQPDVLQALWVSMAANAMTGRIDEARAACQVYRRLDPTARISNMKDRWPATDEIHAKYAPGFRIAGLPE